MEQVPQIAEETGISQDYFNEYNTKTLVLYTGGVDSVADFFRKYPIKKYEERFPSTEFFNVVNDKNRARVQRLDEIAQMVNTGFIDPTNFTEAEFKSTINEVLKLIRGDSEDPMYK